jgi:hypothetical protein
VGSPQNPANKGSLFSEEQEEDADGHKNGFRHLLSALQFPQERQGVFLNRRSAGVHKVSQEGARGATLTGIKCPYCGSSLGLDRIGVHFQKFCSGIQTVAAREAAMKKYNQFYTHLQSQARGEITIEELQNEANKLFTPRDVPRSPR